MEVRPPRFLIMVTLTIFIFLAAAAMLLGPTLKESLGARL